MAAIADLVAARPDGGRAAPRVAGRPDVFGRPPAAARRGRSRSWSRRSSRSRWGGAGARPGRAGARSCCDAGRGHRRALRCRTTLLSDRRSATSWCCSRWPCCGRRAVWRSPSGCCWPAGSPSRRRRRCPTALGRPGARSVLYIDRSPRSAGSRGRWQRARAAAAARLRGRRGASSGGPPRSSGTGWPARLHDVTAHHLTAIVVHAGAARRLGAGRPELVGRRWSFAADTGRRTLTALNRLVTVIEPVGRAASAAAGPARPTARSAGRRSPSR